MRLRCRRCASKSSFAGSAKIVAVHSAIARPRPGACLSGVFPDAEALTSRMANRDDHRRLGRGGTAMHNSSILTSRALAQLDVASIEAVFLIEQSRRLACVARHISIDAGHFRLLLAVFCLAAHPVVCTLSSAAFSLVPTSYRSNKPFLAHVSPCSSARAFPARAQPLALFVFTRVC